VQKLSIVVVFAVLAASQGAIDSRAADKLGKILIKAATHEVNGQQFPDQALEDSAKDLRKKSGGFVLAQDEADAEYLLVVVERTEKFVYAALSFKEGDSWKPAARLSGDTGRYVCWSCAAGDIMGRAADWVKKNRKRQ